MSDRSPTSGTQELALPPGYKTVYKGQPLPPFYAAEMLRPLKGRTVWVQDAGGRVRNGELCFCPELREDRVENIPPAEFVDERPLYLRQIVCIAVYEPPK